MGRWDMVESAQWDVYWPWWGRGAGTRVKGGWDHESSSTISTVYDFKGVFIRGGGGIMRRSALWDMNWP